MGKVISCLILIFFSSAVFAQSKCSGLFTDLNPIKTSQQRISRFQSTSEAFFKLKPKDILTSEYLLLLQDQVGPVTIKYTTLTNGLKSKVNSAKVDTSKFYSGLRMTLMAGSQTVIEFSLLLDQNSNYVTVDGLEVRNPINTDRDHLHANQSAKGAPIEVVNHAQSVIVNQIKRQGWDGILCAGTTHYLVSMLYQRSMKMKPTEKSERYYNYFSIVRKYFSSSDMFYKALGDIKPDYLMVQTEMKWLQMPKDKWEVAGFKPMYIESELVAVSYQDRTYLIDPFDKKSFLHWSKLVSEGQTELILNFK